ncbi:MAG: SGNH/GDSL hydrolase family protein [Myxococcales bacterium]
MFGRMLLIAMCCLCFACRRGPRELTVSADDPSLRYTGWFDHRDPKAVRFAWPGTQVELAFVGSGLRVQLTDTPIEDETRETDWLTLIVDGGPPRTLALSEGRRVYELAKGLPPGPHRALLWKRSEAEVGVVTLHAFVVEGAPEASTRPPVARTRRLVFLGDSITAGYGNEGESESCHWSAGTENNYESYGAHAARELLADYLAAAWSGKGLTRNYDTREALTLPKLWTRAIPTEGGASHVDDGKADVVVVNLGTNDFIQGLPEEREFVSTYRSLLAALHARYAHAALVLALGPMLADDHPQPMARTLARNWIAKVLAGARESGVTHVSSIEFWSDPNEGLGCDYHPNKKTHARMGRELATHIRLQLGW